MKIVVHDYAGHPFQVGLSRKLAARGHDVAHLYFGDDPGPKAAFTRDDDKQVSLRIEPIRIGKSYDKNSLLKRRFDDRAYGRRVASFIRSFEPDVVISGNTPTETQGLIVRACKSMDARFVYWLQDFYSIAVTVHLHRRIGFLSLPVAWYYRLMERRQLRESEAVVAITNDFVPLATAWSGSAPKVTVIENWASIGDIPMVQKDNPWAQVNGIQSTLNFLYAGTLGLKHKPELLVELAAYGGPGINVVVVAEGLGIRHLKEMRSKRGLEGLKLFPLQPAELLPQVLGASDVLVASIDHDSGQFAVPSKVQSYLCAGRPILLAAPRENLAARTVVQANAGIVVEPGDTKGFLAAAARLRDDANLRAEFGARGRAYAERVFDLERITDAFEQVLAGKVQNISLRRASDLFASDQAATASVLQ